MSISHVNVSCCLLFCVGTIIWRALDYGLQEYEEKNLSPDLDRLIDVMTSAEGTLDHILTRKAKVRNKHPIQILFCPWPHEGNTISVNLMVIFRNKVRSHWNGERCRRQFALAEMRSVGHTPLVLRLYNLLYNAEGYGVPGCWGNRVIPETNEMVRPPGRQNWAGLKGIMAKVYYKMFKDNSCDLRRTDDNPSVHQETDDEGIERDSGETDEDPSTSNQLASFDLVIRHCMERLGKPTSQQADAHYRAVIRALVAEALELSTFLEKVSQGTNELRTKTETTSKELDQLQFSDWARLWVQVIRELRNGVKLKKVDYSRTPIEFELTPYEILMDDIRSRRYKLNKVMVDGDIPQKVKKDAHAIILEFIRSRPPLKKASERKLRPVVNRPSTPRELLMDSIKQGQTLRPSTSPLKKKGAYLNRSDTFGFQAEYSKQSCCGCATIVPQRFGSSQYLETLVGIASGMEMREAFW
ncbi:hypothetical protein RUM43_008488 [Polyplax serrata]|uniref:WH2 domain-containing protein n=1 Tax=Polyplax serrata TaxID=468196 RepID=A0AAN8NN18_POLSC